MPADYETSGPTLHRDATRTSARLQSVLTLLDTNPAATVADVRLLLGRHTMLLPLWLLALLSLPFTLIPFTSALFGVLMLFFAAQLTMGRALVWLPQAWLVKPALYGWLRRLYQRLIPLFRFLEHFTRPRYRQFSEAPLHHLSGLLFVALALAIALPIPFGNVAPAIALLFLGLGHMEEDGSLIAIGQCIGLLTLGGLLVIVTLIAGAFGAANLLTGG